MLAYVSLSFPPLGNNIIILERSHDPAQGDGGMAMSPLCISLLLVVTRAWPSCSKVQAGEGCLAAI